MAVMFKHGRGAAQDDAEAVRRFRLAAAQGDFMSQCNLGFIHENGRDAAQDYAEAARWYGLAAAKKGESADSKAAKDALRCALQAAAL